MDLWIRSQDKTILSKVQNIIIRENQNENIAKEYVRLFREENITSLKAVYEMPKE